MRLHIHRDPDWEMHGANAYSECRCGARKVLAMYPNLLSPVTPGWPVLRDRHGMSLRNTGWVKPPEGGWPDIDHDRVFISTSEPDADYDG